MNLYIEYMAPIEVGGDIEEIKELSQTFREKFAEELQDGENLDHVMIGNYLAVRSQEFKQITGVDAKFEGANIE